MRRDRTTVIWTQQLERLIFTLGPAAGKDQWRVLWREAGERLIEHYEDDQRLREALRVLDAVR